jgi:calcineurin-like phosphoesterase family protein
MDECMIKDWNDVVGKDDWVIHLGDFSFNSDRYVNRLNGKIILVKGNHDSGQYNKYFEGVVEFMPLQVAEFNCFLTHVPIDLEGQYKKGREPDFSILDRYQIILCGHVHTVFTVKGKNVNVGVDIWKKPIHVDELVRFLRSLKEKQ